MKQCLNIMALCLMASFCHADFTGFPLADQPTNDWIYLNETYQPVQQIVSAVVERCYMTGVTNLNVAETFSFYFGQTSAVVVVGSHTYTNWCDTYTNIVVTNARPVTYSYNNPTGGITTATVTPPVTRYFWWYLDNKIDTLIPYFVPTNITSYGSLAGFLGDPDNKWRRIDDPTDESSAQIQTMPRMSKAGLFNNLGIGQSTNLTWWDPLTASYYMNVSNQWADGGTSDWTLRVTGTQGWHLAEMHHLSTNTAEWAFIQQQSTNPISRYGIYQTNIFPVLHYRYDTNLYTTALPFNVSVSGTRLNTNNTAETASETIAMTSEYVPSTNRWIYISGMTNSTAGNTNDVVSMLWTNTVILTPKDLGSTVRYATDWEFTASMVDDRWRVLRELVWTYKNRAYTGDPDTILEVTNRYALGTWTNSAAEAIAQITAAWPTSATYVVGQELNYSGLQFDSIPNRYRAIARKSVVQYNLGTFTTASNINKAVDFWGTPRPILVPTNAIGHTYENYGDWSPDYNIYQLQVLASTNIGYATAATSPPLGTLDFPNPFPTNAYPGTANWYYDGYTINFAGGTSPDYVGLNCTIRWDVPGGLEWK